MASNTLTLYILNSELGGLFSTVICSQLVCLSLNPAHVAIIWNQLNIFYWTVDYMSRQEHCFSKILKVCLKINLTLTPKKVCVIFCSVVRNHTFLKNISITNIYSLLCRLSCADLRGCSSMNRINPTTTMLFLHLMDHTDLFSFQPIFQPFFSLFQP